MDLRALDDDLNRKPYGLIVLAAGACDDVRRALWQVLARCETLYWAGPLTEKPVVSGPARTFLVECGLAERASALRSILRFDAHAIHVVGLVDAALAELAVNAALAGHIVVIEVDASSGAAAVAAARGLPLAAHLLDASVVGGVGTDGALSLVRAAR